MARAKAQKEAQSEGGPAGQSEMDAFMDMGKLNTARIRKATDPKIMEVKRRVRQVGVGGGVGGESGLNTYAPCCW
jgi:hypothetical protein